MPEVTQLGPAVDVFCFEQGEWVWLKKFEAGTALELRPDCLSLLRKVGLQRVRKVGLEQMLSGDPH